MLLAQSLKNKYRKKSLLFLGPGKSVAFYNIPDLMNYFDYTATLNDGILFYSTDFI